MNTSRNGQTGKEHERLTQQNQKSEIPVHGNVEVQMKSQVCRVISFVHCGHYSVHLW
jgi:hypothetical protein